MQNKHGVELEQSVEKYFEVEENKAILQQSVKVKTHKEEFVKENESLEVLVPVIQNIKPEEVKVLLNGVELSQDLYTYDNENNLVSININKDLGLTNWGNNSEETYKLIYKYPEILIEENVENSEEVNSEETNPEEENPGENVELTSRVTVKFEDEEQSSENTVNATISKTGENVSVEGVITNEIYKGYMETGYSDTLYNEAYRIEISDLTNVEKLEITNEKEVFTTIEQSEDNIQKIESDALNSTYFKRIWVSKDEITRMLGEEGKIIIKDANDNILKEISVQDEADENGTISFEYPDDTTSLLKVETTTPVAIGNLGINIEKGIRKNTGYTLEQIRSFNYLEETIKVNNSNKTLQMAMRNTELSSKLEISKKTLSTLEENTDVEIKATLINNKLSNRLYTNPSIRIVLPEQVENIVITEANLLYDDELSIAGYSANGREIIVNLQGNQTKYNQEAIEGATIVLKANISLNKTATNSSEKIEMQVTSNNETSTTSGDIEVYSPKEVITVNNINELGIETIGEEETVSRDVRGGARQITLRGEVINNNSGKIQNVKILGNMPVDKEVTQNERTIVNNLGITLNGGISVEGREAKIYYTSNSSATDDLENAQNGWQENPSNLNEMTKYLVVVPEMEKAETLGINYTATIPENAEYNKQAYTDYTVTYTPEQTGVENTADATDIELNTGRGPVLEGTLTATVGGENIENGSSVKKGEVIRYKIDVTNTGTEEATNITVTPTIPENVTVVEPKADFEYEDDYYENAENPEFTIESLPIGETESFEYEVRINEDAEIGSTILTSTRIDYAETYAQTEEISNTIEDANLRVTFKRVSDSDNILQPGVGARYEAVIENISDQTQENIVVVPQLDELLGSVTFSLVEGETIQDVESASEINIGSLEPGEYKKLRINTIMNQTTERETTIENWAIVRDSSNNEYRSNVFTDTIYGILLDFSFTSNAENEYVKTDDVITYEVTTTNNGAVEANIGSVSVNIPNELTVTRVEINGEAEQGELSNNIHSTTYLEPGESETIRIEAVVNDMSAIGENLEITSTATVQVYGEVYGELEIKHIIEKQGDGVNTDPNNPTNPDDPNNPSNPNNPEETGYRISGRAWIDANKDGELQDEEQGMSGVRVTVLDVNTNELVTNSNGNIKVETTDSNGEYTLTGLPEGTYIVLFEYDTNAYSLTTYKKQGVSDGRNSDVVSKSIDIGSGEKIYGVTDNITITDGSIANIDIGLMVAATFDLRLDKTITRIVEQNSRGTNVYTYNNESLARVDVNWRTIQGATLVIEYTIRITNVGELQGYVRNIADYIPEGFEFSTELNKDWYEQGGVLYNQSLTNSSIAPGDYAEVTLTLTKPLSENTVGTVYTNSAEIVETYNERETADATPNDNRDNADFILSISTGRAVTYIGLTIAVVAVLAVGIYFIKKKVLDKN